MRKLLAAALLALPLAACQTTSGPGALGLSRLEAAGFTQQGQFFLCPAERCGDVVVIAYHRQSVSLDGAPFTAEDLVKSKILKRPSVERFILDMLNNAAKPTDRFTSVRFNQQNASFSVKGVRTSGTATSHLAGTLRYRGNEMLGHVAVSGKAALASRYLNLAPAE